MGATAFAPDRGLNPAALGNVIIVGSGLSMVDTLLDLRARGFGGSALEISRHGLYPKAHAAERRPWRMDEPPAPPAGAREGLPLVRRLLREAAAEGADWRAVIDRFRPVTQEIWAGWSEREQPRFLRHLRPYWDVHRHRLPPNTAATLQAELAAGTLQIQAGRVLDMAVGERDTASGARHRILASPGAASPKSKRWGQIWWSIAPVIFRRCRRRRLPLCWPRAWPKRMPTAWGCAPPPMGPW